MKSRTKECLISKKEGEIMDIKTFIIIIFIIILIMPKKKKQRKYESGGWVNILKIEDNKEKGRQFEYYIAELLEDIGYQKAHITPPSADEGRDIDIWKGRQRYAIECKCWNYNPHDWRTKVGHDICRSIMGFVIDKKHKENIKPVIVTTSYFSDRAIGYAKRNGIELIDRDRLNELEKLRDRKKKDKKIGLFKFR